MQVGLSNYKLLAHLKWWVFLQKLLTSMKRQDSIQLFVFVMFSRPMSNKRSCSASARRVSFFQTHLVGKKYSRARNYLCIHVIRQFSSVFFDSARLHCPGNHHTFRQRIASVGWCWQIILAYLWWLFRLIFPEHNAWCFLKSYIHVKA